MESRDRNRSTLSSFGGLLEALDALHSFQTNIPKPAKLRAKDLDEQCHPLLCPACSAIRNTGRRRRRKRRHPAPSIPPAGTKALCEAAPSILVPCESAPSIPAVRGRGRHIIVKATDLIGVPVMVVMQGVTTLIHLIVIIFKPIAFVVPAMPALETLPPLRICAFPASCTSWCHACLAVTRMWRRWRR